MAKLTPFLLIALSNVGAGLLFSDRPQRSIRQVTANRIFPTNSNAASKSPAPSSISRQKATKDDTETSYKSESRLGVRRRVRAVLKRARERTGVENDSELLGSDSTLGYEASAPQLSIDFDSDLLGSDPALSMGASISAETESNKDARLPKNGSTTSSTNGMASPVNGVPDTSTMQAKEPLPFTLPKLTENQQELVLAGERVQEQSKMGREGSGFVVMDIPAPDYAVWEVLLDFEAYPENIGTVRSMRMFTNTHLKQSYYAETPLPPGTVTRHYGRASISRAAFILSKFRLNIAAVHKYVPHPDGHYMVFTLDKATKNAVLQDAKGIWYTQPNPDGKEGITRVWLLCELSVSPYFPTFIVDYAAQRAMPRATTWLRPVVESFLKKMKQ